MMIEKTYATLLFEREYNQTKNRYELEEDFYYEMENFGLVGDFSLTKKELDKDNEGDLFLFKMEDDGTKVTDLVYYRASYAANFSYYFKRRVEFHLFDESQIQQLRSFSNTDDFLQLKNKIIFPNHHLIFDKGELEFFGEIYDIFDFL